MSTEQDSARRLAEIRDDFDRYTSLRAEDTRYLLSLIDSLTAERDEVREVAARWCHDAGVENARAEAAEAEVKRLREALAEAAGMFDELAERIQVDALSNAADLRGEADGFRAALATPPSEGGQS